MEILSIIPARGGSKGIPRKNLKPILNLTLLQKQLFHLRMMKLLKYQKNSVQKLSGALMS